jgi:hypothetical protein
MMMVIMMINVLSLLLDDTSISSIADPTRVTSL